MRPNWISYLLFSALAVMLTAVGCDSSAKGAIPDMSDAALEIVTNATFKSDSAPAPVTPDEKVPRAQCKECNGTGTVTHGDGHKTPCVNCYAAAECSCPCGPECQCENCDGNCLGEYVKLVQPAIYRPEAFNAQPLPVAMNHAAATKPSSKCENGKCELMPSGSGNGCTNSASECSKGSCGSGECHGSGGDCGSCGSGGGERMEFKPGQPARNVARAVAKVASKLRPKNWFPRFRGRCCR